MVIHIFALRWKPDATPAHKERALAAILAFQQSIPGILELHAGSNRSPRSQGYETIGILHFATPADLEAYLTHPTHQAFVQSVAPLIEAVDLDLEV